MINEHILARYPAPARRWLTETIMGQSLWHKVLNVKGCHVGLLGNPGSGKTQKEYWLVSYLKNIETIVWIDSCKDEEIIPLFGMGKPVNVIIPHGMKIEITGVDVVPTIREAFMPDLMWDMIEPGAINIISIRPYFYSEKERSRFYAGLFKALSRKAYAKSFQKRGIDRMTVVVDEAQQILPSTAYTHDQQRLEAAQDVTSNILEVRAFGIRIVTGTQDYINIYPSARRNMPARILCHGANVKSDESRLLNRLCRYAESYTVAQGLFVFPDGDYVPRSCPWSFPYFPKPPGASVDYIGRFDQPEEKDDQSELMPDLGQFSSSAIPPALASGEDLPDFSELERRMMNE